MTAMDRERVDRLLKIAVSAFIDNDIEAYRLAVTELEKAVDKEPGQSNYVLRHRMTTASPEERAVQGRRAASNRWGNKKKFEVEIDNAGVTAYSLVYGNRGDED